MTHIQDWQVDRTDPQKKASPTLKHYRNRLAGFNTCPNHINVKKKKKKKKKKKIIIRQKGEKEILSSTGVEASFNTEL